MVDRAQTTWVTFYSYKGGVGRTLSMVNAARALVNSGRRVVLIDFDLEAPGLDSFDQLKVPADHPGVVEYFAEHLATGKPPDIKKFSCLGGGRKAAVPGPDGENRPPLVVIPSGKKDDDYNAALAELNFQQLYEKGVGQALVEEFRAAVEEEFEPDYVLVDSRTGLTDVGGVCTFVLPDIVVLIYALNRQNVEGIGRIQNAIRKHVLQEKQPIELIRVVSPFPPGVEKDPELDKRLEEVRKFLGVEDVRVPYRPEFGYREDPPSLLPRTEPVSPFADLVRGRVGVEVSPRNLFPRYLVESAEAYRSIADRVISKAPRGIDQRLRELRAKVENPEVTASDSIRTEIDTFARECQRASVVRDLAYLAQSQPDLQRLYLPLLKMAFELSPLDSAAFSELKRLLLRRGKQSELLMLLESSFATAVEIPDKDVEDGAVGLIDELGSLAMSLQKYNLAAKAYGWTERIQKMQHRQSRPRGIDTLRLINSYNHTESRRRAGETIERERLEALVRDFNTCFPETARTTSADFANKLQAISIPLALLGRLEEATRDLVEAKAIAEIMPEDEIFSVVTYRNERPDAFTKHCDRMLGAMLNHQLWDGTDLPPEKSIN
jgi:cellulose biosynthesis protein BcsQ